MVLEVMVLVKVLGGDGLRGDVLEVMVLESS